MFLMIPILSGGKSNFFFNNSKYDNFLYCAKIKYGQIVQIVILATSNRWLDETMWF